MLSGGGGASAVLTLTLSSIQPLRLSEGCWPWRHRGQEPEQLLPVIPLQRGGEFPARLTSRASQQCCTEIRLVVNCSCSSAPLHAPAALLVKNHSLVWLPCCAPQGLLCCAGGPGAALCSAVPTGSGCPPASTAQVNISSLVSSAFKLASLAEKTSVNPQRELLQAPQSQGKASC